MMWQANDTWQMSWLVNKWEGRKPKKNEIGKGPNPIKERFKKKKKNLATKENDLHYEP